MEEKEVVKIDLDVFFAAARAGHPQARALLLQSLQEYYETTGKKLPGVKYETRFTLTNDALIPFALDGDLEPLISYIEKGGDINRDDIRNFILDVLRGKKRPRRRPRLAATFLHHAKIAWCVRVWRADGLGAEAAIKKAMEHFDIRSQDSTASAESRRGLSAAARTAPLPAAARSSLLPTADFIENHAQIGRHCLTR